MTTEIITPQDLTGLTPNPSTHSRAPLTLIRKHEVRRRTTLSESRIYALMSQNAFPKPVKLGAMSVAWIEAEIDAWILERIASSRSTG